MNIVILSATVSPNVSTLLKLKDPNERLLQYQESILAWCKALELSTFKLAVVETSNASPDDLFAPLSDAQRNGIIFSRYSPTADQVRRGKGAIEMAAIQSAISKIHGLDAASTIYKCTGRLSVVNAGLCLTELPSDTVRARMTLDRSYVDTRLIGATFSVWRDCFFGTSDQVDDSKGVYLEHVIAARVSPALALRAIRLSRFPSRPLLAGTSGSTGLRYQKGFRLKQLLQLRQVESLLVRLSARKQA